jgi:hypothetical protein
MRVMNFDGVGLSEWDSPNITGRTRKAVPFAEGAEQVDISFIRFPLGVHSTYHVHPTDQVLIAADGVARCGHRGCGRNGSFRIPESGGHVSLARAYRHGPFRLPERAVGMRL